MRNVLTAPFLAILAVVSFTACQPDYPTCETDKDCKAKGEFCVDRKCQQCRASTDCKTGFECNSGKCSAIAGYCTDNAQCPTGQMCIANRCSACSADGQCPSGQRCMAGRCGEAECTSDDDCPQDKDCVEGRCISIAAPPASGAPCSLTPVYFDFNDSGLTEASRNALTANITCLKKADRPISLVGHADPRGTDEYNLALSDRRSQSVKTYLERLGIPGGRLRALPRGALDATGTDDQSWQRDRRVDLEWQ